jgi:hypothetical protein
MSQGAQEGAWSYSWDDVPKDEGRFSIICTAIGKFS